MAAWYKRKLQEDAALDATMAEVVEYDYFSSIKPPRPTTTDNTNITTPPSTATAPPTSQRAFATDPNLSMAGWQAERDELRVLEQCANQSAVYIGGCAATTATATFVIAIRQWQRSRVGALFSAAGVGLLTASVTWRVWGARCAVDFLQGEGPVAQRGRRRLREEMSDHPVLIQYEDTQRQKRAAGAGGTGTGSGGVGEMQSDLKDAR